MGQRRFTWSAIPRALSPSGRLSLSPVVVVAGLLVVTGASGLVSATSSPSSTADRAAASATVGGARAGAALAAPESSALACPMVPATGGGGTDDVGRASHLFTRTTTDGVTIRTYHLPSSGPCDCGATSSLSVELSDQSAVGQGFLDDQPDPVATTGNARTEPIGLASGAFGVVEGSPTWWTAVTVGPAVTSVSMTYPDGSSDQMSPVDGVAVLAGQIKTSTAVSDDGAYEVRGTLRLLDASGAVVTTVTLPQSTPTPLPTPIQTPVPSPINVPANRTTPLLGTASSSAPSSTSSLAPSASSGSSASSSGSNAASPPAGTGSVIACPEMVTPAEAPVG